MALSAGQYEIVGDDSKVGSYPIKLTATGIAAIKAKFPNIAFSDLSAVSATYTITPNENVVATLSGGLKTYDGKKVSESGFTPTLTLKDGDNVIATVKLERDSTTLLTMTRKLAATPSRLQLMRLLN